MIKEFPKAFPSGKAARLKQPSSSTKTSSLSIFCPEDSCTAVFSTMEDLDEHLLGGIHSGAKISSSDQIKIGFAKRMKSIVTQTQSAEHATPESSSFQCHENDTMTSYDSTTVDYQKGWAIKKRKPATRFNATQRKYLTEQFIKGETSGRKANPEYVAKDMKTYTEDGHKVFKADEYLKRSQIASFFSRMAASRRKATSANEVDQVEAEAEDDDLSTFEEYEDDDIMDQAMEHFDFLDNLETVSDADKHHDAEEISHRKNGNSKQASGTLHVTHHLMKIYGDGNCLFRAIATAVDNDLLNCCRSIVGWPLNDMQAQKETNSAKKLRDSTVKLWKENRQVYESHAEELGFTPFVTEDLTTRMERIMKGAEYAGEPEIIALVHIVQCPIVVHYEHTGTSQMFGETYQDPSDDKNCIHLLYYPDKPGQAGHYDRLVPLALAVGDFLAVQLAKRKWYMAQITNIDGGEIEVKYMKQSADKFIFSDEAESWVARDQIIHKCKVPEIRHRERYEFANRDIASILDIMN